MRAPVPVEITELPDERLAGPVEAAAYYVVAEAITNVAKYAQASHATVSVRRSNGHATVTVSDDGVGGADPRLGTGLRGLADRVEALDGRLDVDSPRGERHPHQRRDPLPVTRRWRRAGVTPPPAPPAAGTRRPPPGGP